ncbi:DUF3616 domain-containing protein [Chitiniphilus purpureus]|uniref:DUF3616 domain-containing protein n=1 Tax=Chitiniphilus purpureus TaxID=2981137 RepID=A0ABY6DJ06_9NEIS|nr:DUF3616 domain-containing protein [Chitiniphilus sp. CD1]UXY14339.1 DUF3616 domain-containing protein [Chitiniphilus sp. CD1]
MPRHLKTHAVRLEFSAGTLVHSNLSGAVFVGDDLWVAGDEACGLDRLHRLAPSGREMLRYGAPANFPLAGLLDLPDAADVEADIEGLDVEDGYLWLVGSHGLKRKQPKPGRSEKDNLRRLATLCRDGNRCLLARIPLIEQHGTSTLARHTADGRQAARLRGDTAGNDLTDLLRRDAHFAPYLAIPGKDNGFDIEGLAVRGDRVLLGLRGPVLRGWAGLLELQPVEKKGTLRLAGIGLGEQRYRKHFVHLAGLGIRDLHWHGDDLYLLAGPTMVLDGAIRVYRWEDAAGALAGVADDADAVLWDASRNSMPREIMALPYGVGQDRAEALTQLPPALAPSDAPHWLVLYDAPGAARHDGDYVVFGDVLSR